MESRLLVVPLAAFLGAALLFTAEVPSADAGISIGINLGPPVVTVEPPGVVLIPGTGVYFVPGFEFDIFFSNGYWWSPRGDRWYRSREYNGPWYVVPRRYVPGPVLRVPGDYRHMYTRERRIPYGQWKKHRGGWRGEERRGWEERGRGRGHDRD